MQSEPSNRNPDGDVDDEEEDDWNPAAEVASDDEADTSRQADEPAEPPKTSRPVSKSRSESRAVSVPDDVEDEDGEIGEARSKSRSREASKGAIGGVNGDDEDGADDGEGAEGEKDGADGANDDEDEDDAEEGDDDEDEVQGHRQKRRKRARNQYIDVEAEVDEEDEEDEDEDDLPQDFVADEHPEDEGLEAGEAADDRRHRELDRRRQEQENLSAEQIAAKMSERYADYGKNRGAPVDAVVVPQRLLLPSVDDPTIWGVRCRPGKEREIVFAITKRIEQRLDTPGALRITSAFERGGTMAGFVYVEGRTKADVKLAVDGIINVFMSRDMVLVPIQEMPDLLRTKKSKSIDPGMWVRIKRGKYQGDLAYVEEVHENGLEVELKIVPREDYGADEDPNAPMIGMAVGAAAKRKRQNAFGKNAFANRPPARLFNENEAKKRHARYLQQIDNLSAKKFQYQGNTYIGGFLIKSFKVNLLQVDDVNPTLEEVSKFTGSQDGEGSETLDLQKLAATLKQTSADSFLPGDAVEIYSGEQRGVIGTAVAVRGDIVTLRATEGELKGSEVEAPVKDLRKRFNEGDHVKVIGGSKYIDEVGMVVKIRDNRVTLLSDATNQEITVFSKDLREATDSGAAIVGGKYDLHDLVQLDPATVGIVVKVDRESLRILTQNDEVRTLLPSAISGKLEKRRYAVSTDKEGTEIRNDDTIKESSGDGRQGRIMHIHRAFLFIQNRQQTENSGIFVAKTSAVLAVAAKGGRPGGGGTDLTKMNPAMQRNGAGGASAMAPPSKQMGRDRLIGKTCTIRKGPYKGLLGIIKDTTDTEARVELHTKSKVIAVSKDVLGIKDPITGQNMDMSRMGGGRGPGDSPGQDRFGGGGGGGMTPARPSWGAGGRTPLLAGPDAKTPAWSSGDAGAKTPAWSSGDAGAKTPGWSQQAGGRTPAAWNTAARTAYGGADGGRTAYGGGWGGGTAYGGGGQTAYGGAGGGQTAYGGPSWSANPGNSTPWQSGGGGGGRTPAAWNQPQQTSANDGGNRTAYGGGGFDAPTPFGAPTPGAPTPGAEAGAARSANPYGGAPTPGAYGSARTPGAVGGEGGDEGYE